MLIDEDLEDGNLGPFQDRPRTFPNMHCKAYMPWDCRVCWDMGVCSCNVQVSSAARRSAREALQVDVRASGFSAMVVIGMAILYATFYVWLGVDSIDSMKVIDCFVGFCLL